MPPITTTETLEEIKPAFPPDTLNEEDSKDYSFFKKRVIELQEARKYANNYSVDVERVWAEADREYIPHRSFTKGKRTVATDETLGWRGTFQKIGDPDWQSDIAQPNVYIKIQTALSILVDQNPSGVFTAASKKYDATSDLYKQLYERSWEYAKSKQQLKLFIYNLAKYGWAIARTYPLRIEREVKNVTKYDNEDPQKTTWEKNTVVEYDDIFRENLDPFNCWIDDMAKPNNPLSIRDWAWRKVYSYDEAEELFGKYKNFKYVKPNMGITSEKVDSLRGQVDKKYKESKLVEAIFYENKLKDLYVCEINKVPVIMEPLPVADTKGLKKLSCWQTYWTLRHAESPYGIGVFEAMRYDNSLMNRIRNMTVDQIVLSIYKMFFYQGTSSLTDTGEIRIQPGIGKQMLDPKTMQWMEVPGPGPDAWKGLEMLQKDLQDDTGISETLQGKISGKTAFEIAQAKEAALKRLKTPLDNILDALQQEGYITVSLISLMYSVPETFEIADQAKIEEYLREIQSDPELYERSEAGAFTAKVYREFPLNLDKDEKGNLTTTEDTRFFRVKPSGLKWEGIINIKPQSILSPSKQIDKALELEMVNIIAPMLANPPEVFFKIAKQVLKLYDKDPKEWLPDAWLQQDQKKPVLPQPQGQGGQQPLFVPANGQSPQPGAPGQPPAQGAPAPSQGNPPTIAGGLKFPLEVPKGAEKLTTNPQLTSNPGTAGGKIINKIKKPGGGKL